MSRGVEDALFDELGPRGQARLKLWTITAGVVVAGVIVAAVAQLAHSGQLAASQWQPLVTPSSLRFLGKGLLQTIQIGVTGAALSLVLGMAGGLGRLSPRRIVSVPCAAAIEFFRSVPLLLLVYFFVLGGPPLGLQLSKFWQVTVPIVLHAGAVFAEIVRAGINSLDRGQYDAAMAIGMRRGQAMRLIVLPQALRVLRPALISQLIRALKESSLGYVVGYSELLNRSQILSEYSGNLLQAYLLAGAGYVALNLSLSWVAGRLDRPAGRAAVAPAGDEALPAPEPERVAA
jgi:glutamate transport system permease protein